MPKISVTTGTFNRPHLLPRAIESVLNQSFEDFEYFIINNGSTDNTKDVLSYYAKQDSRIKIITLPKNTLSNGISPIWLDTSSGSHLLTPVDDDDWIHKDMLDKLYTISTSTNSDICSVGSQYVFPDGSIQDKFVYDGMYTLNRVEAMFELLRREKINSAMGGKLYKKHLFKNLQLPDVPRVRDIHREYRTMNNISQMTLTGEPMYFYYRHGDNISGLNTIEQITPEKMHEHLLANRIRTEWLIEKMPEIKEFVEYSEYSFMISLYNRILSLKVVDCYPIAEQMRQTLVSKKPLLENSQFVKVTELDILAKL